MIDGLGISAEAVNGIGVVAVVLLVAYALIRGHLVTKREADSYRERAEKAEANEAQLLRQNAELMEMSRLGRATWEALHRNAIDEEKP